MLSIATAAAALIFAASSPAPAVVTEPDPKAMSQAEIRAFNASVGKDHDFYIRCKRSVATGSFLRANTSCRTNAQWAAANDQGNDKARDFVEATNKGWSRGN